MLRRAGSDTGAYVVPPPHKSRCKDHQAASRREDAFAIKEVRLECGDSDSGANVALFSPEGVESRNGDVTSKIEA